MKKILLTLLTLFMASSMFAEDYCYLADTTLVMTKPQAAFQIKVPVKAHFDAAVSAATVKFTLPEGLTLRKIEKGSSITGLTYLDDWGEECTAANTIFTPNASNNNFAFATVDKGYYQVDNKWVEYGAVKFLPGEYAQMAILTFVVDPEFTDGEISVRTQPDCGADARPDVEECPTGQDNTHTATISIRYIAPEPVMTWNPDTYTMTLSVPEGYDAHDFVLYANGTQVELDENNSYTVEQTDEEQKIVFTAYTVHDDTETYDSNDATYGKLTEYEEVTVPAKVVEQTDKPSVTYSNETPGEIMVWAYGVNDEGVVYTLYCDGVEYTGEMPITYDIYEGYNHTWTATALAPGKTVSEMSAECPIIIEAQQKPLAPKATMAEDVTDTQVTVTFTPAEGTAVSVKVGEETVNLPYVINRPAYGEDPITVTFEVTVTGDNYTTNTYTETVTVQPQAAPAPAPTFREADGKVYAECEGHTVVMEVKNSNGEWVSAENPYTLPTANYEADQQVEFRAKTIANEGENGDSDWEEYTATVKKLEKKDVAAPVISTTMDDNNVYVTITWPESDGEQVYTGEYTYARTGVDQSFNVEAYVKEGSEWKESEHATETIRVPAKELKGEIVFGDVDPETGKVPVSYSGEEEGVTLSVVVKDQEGNETTLTPDEDGNIQLPAEGTYDITVTATADGYKPMTETAEDVNWTKPTADPVITYTNENGVLTVTATGTDASTVTLTVGDQTATGVGSVSIEVEYNEAEGIEVTATATAKEENRPVSNEVTEEIKIDAIAVTATPTITVTRDESFYYVKATGNGEVKLYIDGEPITLRADSPEAKLAREEEDYTVTATATAQEEDKLISETATKEVLVKKLVEKPEKPEITITPTTDPETNDVLSVAIEITPAEGTELPEGAEIWYSLDGEDPVQYTGEFEVNEDDKHTIEAWVVVKDEDENVAPTSIDVESETAKESFEIGEGTAVNELVNGKQIAGVRYFNMAGQEMQEANGITIVVTTYTDGTTSTVKVMK